MENNPLILKKLLTMGSSSSIMSTSRAGYGNLLIGHKEFKSWMD